MAQQETIPIIIIGGGIVGLSASLFLSAYDIKHILVERHSGTSIHPRARSVNARTMELFHSVGIDEAVREVGTELSPSSGFYSGSSLVEIVDPLKRRQGPSTGKFAGAEWFESGCPIAGARGTQDFIEPVLLQAAKERGADTRFSTEMISFSQNSTGVTIALRHRLTGKESTVQADYMIAADGANSPVRHQLDVPTTGKGNLGNLLNILFHCDLKSLVQGREFSLALISRPEVRGLFTSINNSDRWVFHLSYDPSKGEKVEDFPPERCTELLKLALGMPDAEIEIKSILPWEATERVVEKMQHGRVFLAGDAAHTMTPYRGQGANSGIADVHNLAWKLSLVFKSQAPPSLLQTYDEERLPVGIRAAEESRIAAGDDGLVNIKTFKAPLNLLRIFPLVFGYGYTYTSKTIIPESPSSRWWWWWWWSIPWTLPSLLLDLNGRPGTRAPHTYVQYNGKSTPTLDLFGKCFVLISGSEGKGWCDAAEQVAEEIGVEMKAYRVGPTGDLLDPKRSWEKVAGISSKGAVLVRPDGFVCWRARDQTGELREEIKAVLKQALCREE